jgi:virginiamycin B lyase
MKRLAAPLCLAVAAWMTGAPGSARSETLNPVPIDEWPVPFAGHGRDPYAAGPDEIWFVGQQGHYLARFTPSTAAFLKVDLPPGTGPHNNVVDSGGRVWYSANASGEAIGYYEPESEKFTNFALPGSRDPHTLVFDEDEQHLWFTVQFGNQIGRMTMADHEVEVIDVPTASSRPYGIKLAPDGTPWIVLFGTNKLAKVDPASMALTEITLPAADARPRRLEITSDGRIWYADFARGSIGLYDPAKNEFGEWPLPGGTSSRPYGMAVDDEDRVWLVETGVMPNQFVGFDTEREAVVSITEIPSGAGAVRHMDYEESTGSVWFGTDEDTLGRARVKAD